MNYGRKTIKTCIFGRFHTRAAQKREILENGHHQSKDLVKVAYENPPYIGGVDPLLSSQIEFEGNLILGISMKADLRAWDRLYPPYIGGFFGLIR